MNENRIECFDALYDKNSSILILGSMPSVVSLKYSFYYMHPSNRFWRVMAEILDEKMPLTIDDRKRMLLTNSIALWDIVFTCERKGSLDSNIKNEKTNDLYSIPQIKEMKIFINGQTATKLFKKYYPELEYISLPSTSSANVRFDIEKWYSIKDFLQSK